MHPKPSPTRCITLYSYQQGLDCFQGVWEMEDLSPSKHEDTWTASASLRVDLSLLKPLIRAERADG